MKGKYILLLLVLTLSCNKQELTKTEVEDTHYEMIFEGVVNGFDGELLKSSSSTRLTDAGLWENGDQIFIVFTTPTKKVSGTAIYLATDDVWDISIDSFLPMGANKCQIVYIDRYDQMGEAPFVTLTSKSAIFEDANASYSVNEERQLHIQANLTPKTSRVRFQGSWDDSTTLYIAGIQTYSSFDLTTGEFSTSNQLVRINTSTDGLSPYIYGNLVSESKRVYALVRRTNDSWSEPFWGAQTRFCDDEEFQIAKSGQMNINSGNWLGGIHCNLMGVEFAMYSFNHQYCNGLLGETEVTEALYQSVNGTPSTSMLPQTNLSYNEAIAFTQKLSTLLPFTFSLPDYSSLTDFCNMSLGAMPQYYDKSKYGAGQGINPVKQYMPFSGFYDLLGNADEWRNGTVWAAPDGINWDNYYTTHGEPATLDADEKLPNAGLRLFVNINSITNADNNEMW